MFSNPQEVYIMIKNKAISILLPMMLLASCGAQAYFNNMFNAALLPTFKKAYPLFKNTTKSTASKYFTQLKSAGLRFLNRKQIAANNQAQARINKNAKRLLQTGACRNCDFTGCNNFSVIANEAHRRFGSVDLADSNLEGVDLSVGGWLPNSNFARTNLRKANLAFGNFKGSNFENADMTKATLVNTVMQNTNLKCTRLKSVNARHAQFQDAKFDHTDMRKIKVHGTTKFSIPYNELKEKASIKGHTLLTDRNFDVRWFHDIRKWFGV